MTFAAALDTHYAGSYPDLPVPMKNGVGARVGHMIYVGLGSAGSAWFSLDLSRARPQWHRRADFPAAQRDQSIAVPVDGRVYVFGGAGQVKDADGTPVTGVLHSVYCFDPMRNAWQTVPTLSPQSLLGAVGVSTDGRRVLFFGGVNQAIFDGYFRDIKAAGNDQKRKDAISEAYFGKRPQDYQFSTDVLSYEPARNAWRTVGKGVYPPTVGPAVAVDAKSVTLVNGELKPGLRSYQVNQAVVEVNAISWRRAPDLIPSAGQSEQEGVAGAFAGYSNGVLLVAGGANFPGAWKQYREGRNHAHFGLGKAWHDDIYALVDSQWLLAGHLPQARAYGVSLQLDDGVLLIGGENENGEAAATVQLMYWDGASAGLVTP